MSANPVLTTNGVITAPNGPAGAAVNRKKQKRRQKQAAKAAAEREHLSPEPMDPTPPGHGQWAPGAVPSLPSMDPNHGYIPPVHQDSMALPEDYDDEPYDTEEEGQAYAQHYANATTNGYPRDPSGANASQKKNKKKKKKKASASDPHNTHAHAPYPPTHAMIANRNNHHGISKSIWNTSTSEERERIKEFWLALEEDERKSLVKIEKDAVLKKMKEQQKHSCSCTVCGRKRNAIEEELELLYDAYYDELEGYVIHNPEEFFGAGAVETSHPLYSSRRLDPEVSAHDHAYHRNSHHVSLPPDRLPPLVSHPPRPSHGQIQELPDDDVDDEADLEDGEEYSDEDDYDEEDDYSDQENEDLPRAPTDEFLNFGNSLTVKGESALVQEIQGIVQNLTSVQGGILTVADDLLKNDGRKFIEMMEQLAERRMQREEYAQDAASAHPSTYQTYGHSHDPPVEDDEFDDEDEEEYDSQDEYEEDDEEIDYDRNEQQRMEEGRRMFQIFAARMFEQRVLTAYREKVAQERQQRLLEELEEEKTNEVERDAKKAAQAEKKKQKKQMQKQKQQEEKARKDAEKAAEEARAKEAEERRQDEARRKREELKKKKEAERKAAEDERLRKEADRLKRQQEERDRQLEAERKVREAKAAEKKAKDDAKKKEREEREAKEREVRERKAHAEKERREREAKAKAEKEAQEQARREASQTVPTAAPTTKRPSAPTAVPMPPAVTKQPSSLASPNAAVTTPAIPKAPTPVKPRQSSQQGSKGSSPKTPYIPSGPSTTSSPGTSASTHQSAAAPKAILQKPTNQLPLSAAPSIPPVHPLQSPPPGMSMSQGPPSFVHPGMNGFHPAQPPMMQGMGPRGAFPPFQSQQQMPMANQFRPFGGPPPGIPGPPPGLQGLQGPPAMSRPFDGPPGLHQHPPGLGMPAPMFGGPGRDSIPPSSESSHSRHPSGTIEKGSTDSPIAASQAGPISRPNPIQRPGSAKHDDDTQQNEVDELARNLGSKALIDENDEPLPVGIDIRRPSGAPGAMPSLTRGLSNVSSPFGSSQLFNNAPGPGRLDSFGGLGSVGSPGSSWGTPALPFGQSNAPPTWGGVGSPTSSGWPSHNPLAGFVGMPPSGGGPPLHHQNHHHPQPHRPRPQLIRAAICTICRQLADTTPDGFVDITAVMRQMERAGLPPLPVTEVLAYCDAIGDGGNGGGSFDVALKGNAPPESARVRFHPDPQHGFNNGGSAQGLGWNDLGSPGSAVGVGGGGPFGNGGGGGGAAMRGFPGLGPQGV